MRLTPVENLFAEIYADIPCRNDFDVGYHEEKSAEYNPECMYSAEFRITRYTENIYVEIYGIDVDRNEIKLGFIYAKTNDRNFFTVALPQIINSVENHI